METQLEKISYVIGILVWCKDVISEYNRDLKAYKIMDSQYSLKAIDKSIRLLIDLNKTPAKEK